MKYEDIAFKPVEWICLSCCFIFGYKEIYDCRLRLEDGSSVKNLLVCHLDFLIILDSMATVQPIHFLIYFGT